MAIINFRVVLGSKFEAFLKIVIMEITFSIILISTYPDDKKSITIYFISITLLLARSFIQLLVNSIMIMVKGIIASRRRFHRRSWNVAFYCRLQKSESDCQLACVFTKQLSLKFIFMEYHKLEVLMACNNPIKKCVFMLRIIFFQPLWQQTKKQIFVATFSAIYLVIVKCFFS